MIIAIDAGNSRIKWGVHDGRQWLDHGTMATADIAFLSEAADEWPDKARVVVCNVAGRTVAAQIESLVQAYGKPVFLYATAESCGVRSNYDNPVQLGADRWAALIGARARRAAATLVVCAGTATTVDLMGADGVFQGGLILPGFNLMRSALASNTAQLPLAEGVFRTTPCNTLDAIFTGCLHAQLGAIERMFALLADQPEALCLVTGGGAETLVRHLPVPCQRADHLILDGLVRYAVTLPAIA